MGCRKRVLMVIESERALQPNTSLKAHRPSVLDGKMLMKTHKLMQLYHSLTKEFLQVRETDQIAELAQSGPQAVVCPTQL